MKKLLLKGFGVAMAMLGASAVSAAVPENLYMCGGATSVNWDSGNAVEFTKTADGVFTYEGTLFADHLILMTEKGWGGTRIVPEANPTDLEETNSALSEITGGSHFENHWVVKSTGTWKLTVVFNEEGDNVMVAAKKQQTQTPEHLYMCGPATSAGWSAENGVEFTSAGDGVFTYVGDMNEGELIIMDVAGWDGTRYAPMNANTKIEKAATSAGAVLAGDFRRDYHWVINVTSKWKLTVTFTGTDIEITAENLNTPIPENLYMCGPATSANWDAETNPVAFTKTSDGVFTYEGDMYRGDFILLTDKSWKATRYAPEKGSSDLEESKIAVIAPDWSKCFDYHWVLGKAGIWKLTVTFAGNSSNAAITGEYLSGPSQVIPLGSATGQWYSEKTDNKDIKAVTPGVYEWQGAITDTQDIRHFKFISRTGEWNSNIDYYLPAETDGSGNNGSSIKTVEFDKEYPVKIGWEGNGNLESYWSLPAEACTPDKIYKATLNLNNNTIKFVRTNTSVNVSEIADATLKARFVGDDLIVEGASADIEVYDISGRKVAQSNSGTLTASGLSNGIYVVKAAGTSIKIAK